MVVVEHAILALPPRAIPLALGWQHPAYIEGVIRHRCGDVQSFGVPLHEEGGVMILLPMKYPTETNTVSRRLNRDPRRLAPLT